MNTPLPSGDDDRTESHDSVLFEFIDPVVEYTPRPPREDTLRHAPSWLREKTATRASSAGQQALGACRLAQARALMAAGHYSEALPVAEEAMKLYETAGLATLADCLHLAAEIHQALGRTNEASELLSREAELRRKLNA